MNNETSNFVRLERGAISYLLPREQPVDEPTSGPSSGPNHRHFRFLHQSRQEVLNVLLPADLLGFLLLHSQYVTELEVEGLGPGDHHLRQLHLFDQLLSRMATRQRDFHKQQTTWLSSADFRLIFGSRTYSERVRILFGIPLISSEWRVRTWHINNGVNNACGPDI